MALVMALGITTVLTITGTSIAYYSTSNAGSANRARVTYSAYSLAEAGMNDALSVLAGSFQPATPTALPPCSTPTSGQLEGGTFTFCGSLAGTTWTVTATGAVKNPATAHGNVVSKLTRSVSIAGLNSGANITAWDRLYHDDTSSCLTIPQKVIVPVNIASRGDLCLIGSAITGGTTNVQVGGKVTLTPAVASDADAAANAVSSGPGTAWANPANALANDNQKTIATLAAGASSQNLDVTGFGFALPVNATVTGLTALVEELPGKNNAISDVTVQLLKNGVATGTNKAAAGTWNGLGGGGGNANATFGSANDLWGTTWSYSDVDAANFGIRLAVKNTSGSQTTASIDFVQITVNYSLDASIGLTGPPIQRVNQTDIVGTCKWSVQAADPSPCADSDHVYATTRTSSATLAKPTVDFAYWYANAAPGPMHGCTSWSGTPPVFDSDTTYNGSARDVHLVPNDASYTCVSKDAQGNTIGQLSWNNLTQVLTVQGTIFFDGKALFDEHHFVVHYVGRATIYIAKGTHIDSQVCAGGTGASSCRTTGMSTWDPTQNLLVLILGDKNAAGTDDCKIDETDSAFQGVIWVKNACDVEDGADISSPIIATDLSLSSVTNVFAWPPLGSLLPGQIYGNAGTSSDFLITPGKTSG